MMLQCQAEASIEAMDTEAWQKKSRVKKVLFETGAQVNACRKDFAKGGTKIADASVRLFGVGMHEVKNYGRYQVPFDLNHGETKCSAEWEVSEVSKDVMTAGGLIATGNYSA